MSLTEEYSRSSTNEVMYSSCRLYVLLLFLSPSPKECKSLQSVTSPSFHCSQMYTCTQSYKCIILLVLLVATINIIVFNTTTITVLSIKDK